MSVPSSRIRVLNKAESQRSGRYVLYWMQQSQRARFNPALELAIEEANARDLPVLVCFGLMDGYPEANARHYAFMLEGLAEVERDLNERGIGFVIRRGAPDAVALQFASEAALVVCDRVSQAAEGVADKLEPPGSVLRRPGRGRCGRPGRDRLAQARGRRAHAPAQAVSRVGGEHRLSEGANPSPSCTRCACPERHQSLRRAWRPPLAQD